MRRLNIFIIPLFVLIGSGRPIGYGPPQAGVGGGGYSADITEDFDCADSSGEIDCDLDWTENNTGNLEIQTNRIITSVGNGDPTWAYNATNLASDNHCAQVDIELNETSTNRIFGEVFVRHDGTSTQTFYGARIREDSGISERIQILEVTAGTEVQLSSKTYSITQGQAYTMRLCANGSSLELFVDGVSELTASDSTLTGRTRTGFQLRNNSGSVSTEADNFEAGTIK